MKRALIAMSMAIAAIPAFAEHRDSPFGPDPARPGAWAISPRDRQPPVSASGQHPAKVDAATTARTGRRERASSGPSRGAAGTPASPWAAGPWASDFAFIAPAQ